MRIRPRYLNLKTEASHAQFRHDFGQMAVLVQQHSSPSRLAVEGFLPCYPPLLGPARQDAQLHEQQRQLSHSLETAASLSAAQHRLLTSALTYSAWKVEQWSSTCWKLPVVSLRNGSSNVSSKAADQVNQAGKTT